MRSPHEIVRSPRNVALAVSDRALTGRSRVLAARASADVISRRSRVDRSGPAFGRLKTDEHLTLEERAAILQAVIDEARRREGITLAIEHRE